MERLLDWLEGRNNPDLPNSPDKPDDPSSAESKSEGLSGLSGLSRLSGLSAETGVLASEYVRSFGLSQTSLEDVFFRMARDTELEVVVLLALMTSPDDPPSLSRDIHSYSYDNSDNSYFVFLFVRMM